MVWVLRRRTDPPNQIPLMVSECPALSFSSLPSTETGIPSRSGSRPSFGPGLVGKRRVGTRRLTSMQRCKERPPPQRPTGEGALPTPSKSALGTSKWKLRVGWLVGFPATPKIRPPNQTTSANQSSPHLHLTLRFPSCKGERRGRANGRRSLSSSNPKVHFLSLSFPFLLSPSHHFAPCRWRGQRAWPNQTNYWGEKNKKGKGTNAWEAREDAYGT